MPLTRDETRGSGVAVAVDLINTWDELHPKPDLIEGLADVRVWLGWHGLGAAARRLNEGDVDLVRELRARLERVFDSTDEAEAAARLNELARDYGTAPQLGGSTGSGGCASAGGASAARRDPVPLRLRRPQPQEPLIS
jgi:Putative stress-induced transcription regulator